ncbi:unnamed protein product [Calicophoron daubneyi]|uniref:GPI transamidase component PIG-T n=1 Tax=Calicophoron daubneyi TaxID=300641 RepID=A0AAV2TWF2_CALDB
MGLVIFLLPVFGLAATSAYDSFSEELLIKDLGSGFTGFHFHFVSKVPEYENSQRHYDLIPKSVLQILPKYSAEEFHLSMVRGYWDNENWGRNFIKAPSSGAELWSWFRNDTVNVDRAWFELTHALSGQLCASLNRLASRDYSIIPAWSHRPTGVTLSSQCKSGTGLVRYGQIPREGLCSENITPWVKLLPCKDLRGLASLIVPTSVFRANYDALTIGLRRICLEPSCSALGFELTQTLTVVFDRRLLYGNINLSWSIQGLLGSRLKGSCSAAQSSRVFLLTSAGNVSVSSDLRSLPYTADPRVQGVYDSANVAGEIGNTLFTTSYTPSDSLSRLPLVSLTKYVAGSGVEDGAIRALLTSHTDIPVRLVYMDLIPWYTQVFFHTLQLYVHNPNTMKSDIMKPEKVLLTPSLARKRMGSIQLVITLPPRQQLTVSYTFRRILQRWDEYPADAHNGYALPAAVVSYQIPDVEFQKLRTKTPAAFLELTLPTWASTYTQYFNESFMVRKHRPGDGFVSIHSPVVMVDMPTPDFSMPFNALCIVCSVVALLFGSVHKTTSGTFFARVPKSSKLSVLLKRLWPKRKRDQSPPTKLTSPKEAQPKPSEEDKCEKSE